MSNAETRTATCTACGRTRTFRSAGAAAKAAPYGRVCAARRRSAIAAEAAAAFKPETARKALELIADGGLVATSRPGVYRAVSSCGEVTYLVAEQACGCAAGLRDRLCYHRAGVAILNALTRKAA